MEQPKLCEYVAAGKEQATERSRDRYRRIVLTGGAGIVGRAMTALISLVSVPLTIGYLGKERFGLWMVLNSLVAWLQLADIGISNGLVNALAEANGRDDREAASGYITTALLFLSGMGLLCLLPVILLARFLPWSVLLHLQDNGSVLLARQCFLIVGLLFVANFPLSLVNRIFYAYQLGYLANACQIAGALAGLTGLLAAVHWRLAMSWLVTFVAAGPVLANLLCWFWLGRRFPWYRFQRRGVAPAALRRIARSSIPLFLFQIGGLLVNQAVNFVLAFASGLRLVADYNVLQKVYLLIFFLGTSIAMPFYPAIREACERQEMAWVRRSVRHAVMLRMGIVSLCSFPLILVGDRLVRFWIRQSLDSTFGWIGWMLFAAAMGLAALCSTFSEILLVLDEIWPQLKIVLLNGLVTLGGIFFLCQRMAVRGVYLAMVLAVLYPAWWCYHALRKKVRLDVAAIA